MKIISLIIVNILLFTLAGCSSGLTKEEIENQNRASTAVTNALFNNDVSESATYSINKKGEVEISFDKSVPEKTYTTVVHQLRANPLIKGVWAWQGNAEICTSP